MSPIAAKIRSAKPSVTCRPVLTDDPVPPTSQSTERSSSNSELVIAGLSAGEGVTIADLCRATGWQPHSCRAFFTGLRKNGRPVERGKRLDGTTVYKLAEGEGAAR